MEMGWGEGMCSRGARGEQAPGDEGFWLLRDRECVGCGGFCGECLASPIGVWGPSSQPARDMRKRATGQVAKWLAFGTHLAYVFLVLHYLGATSASRPGHDVWVQTRSDVDGVSVCGIQQVQRNEQTADAE